MRQDRLKKMNSTLKRIIGSSISRNLSEIQANFGLITVNSVRLSSDMSYLDVFVSSIKNGKLLCKTLANYAQIIKEDINRELIMRKMPIIRFRYDNEIEFTTNLISKINSLKY